jgi:hypothetical protein
MQFSFNVALMLRALVALMGVEHGSRERQQKAVERQASTSAAARWRKAAYQSTAEAAIEASRAIR